MKKTSLFFNVLIPVTYDERVMTEEQAKDIVQKSAEAAIARACDGRSMDTTGKYLDHSKPYLVAGAAPSQGAEPAPTKLHCGCRADEECCSASGCDSAPPAAPSQPPGVCLCSFASSSAESNRATHCAPAPSQGAEKCPVCGKDCGWQINVNDVGQPYARCGKPTRRNAPAMCACHDDGPPLADGRCATCLLPRRAAPSQGTGEARCPECGGAGSYVEREDMTWPCPKCCGGTGRAPGKRTT